MYHRITTEPVWYTFHSCGNFCGTHLYNRGTTQVPQDIFVPHDYHTVIGPLPQNLCGIFFIPVVISVVLTNRGTTQVPQKYHRTFLYHRITTQITTEPVWYIFHSCGNFCGTYLYNRGTTQVPQSTTQVPQSPTGFFCKGPSGLFTTVIALTQSVG